MQTPEGPIKDEAALHAFYSLLDAIAQRQQPIPSQEAA